MDLLSRFVHQKDDFATFHKSFYFHFADDIRDDSFTDDDWKFFGEIHEKLDMVADDPDPESRKYGWISVHEFRKWLEDLLAGKASSS